MQVRVSVPEQVSSSPNPNAASLYFSDLPSGVKMLSFSSPENKIGGAEVLSQDLAISITQNRSCRTSSAAGNQTPLKKQETVDCVEEPGTSSPLRTKCAFQFNYTQNNKVCGQHQESKYSCLSDSNDKEITELEKPKDATFDLPLPSIRFRWLSISKIYACFPFVFSSCADRR